MYGDWHVRVLDQDMLRRSVTLYLAQDRGDKYAVLMGDGSIREFNASEQADEQVGVHLPIDAWRALEGYFKPLKDTGEVKRLEEALALERARVDHALGRV